MSTIGNLLWLLFGGLLSSLSYAFAGFLLCLTVIGIPFGLQSFRMAGAVLTPFGKEVRSIPRESGVLGTVFNLIWIVLFGWEIAMVHISAAILCAVTIIGIPFAIQHMKLVVVALLPFGHRLEVHS